MPGRQSDLFLLKVMGKKSLVTMFLDSISQMGDHTSLPGELSVLCLILLEDCT